jgi:hypothetical protein
MSTVGQPIQRAVGPQEAAIGRKAVMAVAGAILFGYVIGRLSGNLQIFCASFVVVQ